MDQLELSKLREHLKLHIVSVSFTKKDGTQRNMYCTLKPEALPPQVDLEESIGRKTNDDVVAVFDIEYQGWRSFRHDSVISWRVV